LEITTLDPWISPYCSLIANLLGVSIASSLDTMIFIGIDGLNRLLPLKTKSSETGSSIILPSSPFPVFSFVFNREETKNDGHLMKGSLTTIFFEFCADRVGSSLKKTTSFKRPFEWKGPLRLDSP